MMNQYLHGRVCHRSESSWVARCGRVLGLLALAASIVLLPSCQDLEQGAKHADVPDARVRTGMPVVGATLPEEAGRALLKQCTRAVPRGVTGFWIPSERVVSHIEARLPNLLDSALTAIAPAGGRHRNQTSYYRQYLGLTKWNGRRTVYINGFRRDHLTAINSMRRQINSTALGDASDTVRWRSTPISACDGGAMFFGIEYNPEHNGFGRLEFNRSLNGRGRY